VTAIKAAQERYRTAHRSTSPIRPRHEPSAASPDAASHAATAQLEQRQHISRLHGISITDDDHRLRRNRTHLRVADVLFIDAEDFRLSR
jgi:hypothetical protein